MADNAMQEKRETVAVEPERTRSGRAYVPNVDIIERSEELLLLADVPGAGGDDVNIRYENGLLTIDARVAERQGGDTRYLLREYGVGDYYREFRIGESIDASKIQAEVKNGVLTIHLPKAEAIKPRKIRVTTG